MLTAARDVQIKKLLYRSKYRGQRELDFLLYQFAQDFLPHADPAMLNAYSILLNIPDHILQQIIEGCESCALDEKIKRFNIPDKCICLIHRISNFFLAQCKVGIGAPDRS